MSSKKSRSSKKDYIITNSGTNSRGNHYCHRESSEGAGYHYSNKDGSWYYHNQDGSRYFDDGKGHAKYTDPSGNVHLKGSSEGDI
ncbi:hypothetical protein BKA93DRAFT_759492 [Sparassis latifolia]|uniref:Uncharacterized protein n=1 Tax=Sparassis crispa TaxID=139825 RepID=A0A401H5C3_9APHY|nr:hypothetical protein SCP_1602770 [Sparassis crispa]GBE89614.1 hypothetical protein SCP_1602770 [Sparassis crispa]